MCEVCIKSLIEITEFIGIIKKWVLSIRIDIDNMEKMSRRDDTSVYGANKHPLREYVRRN